MLASSGRRSVVGRGGRHVCRSQGPRSALEFELGYGGGERLT